MKYVCIDLQINKKNEIVLLKKRNNKKQRMHGKNLYVNITILTD